jgi:hypothetical protein
MHEVVRAVRAAARPIADTAAGTRSMEEDAAECPKRMEAAFWQEQAQWGQFTSQIDISDDTRT